MMDTPGLFDEHPALNAILPPKLKERIKMAAEAKANAEQPTSLTAVDEPYRILPNEIARSALFNARSKREERRHFDRTLMAQVGDAQIYVTGEELRQDDELVFLELVKRAYEADKTLRSSFTVSCYDFAKSLGMADSKINYERVFSSILRMAATRIDLHLPPIKRPNGRQIDRVMFGTLVLPSKYEQERVSETGEVIRAFYHIRLNDELVPLFETPYYTLIHMPQRVALPTGIASKLHSYFSSHKEPLPAPMATLKKLCDSTASDRAFTNKLRDALNQLVEVGFLSDFKIRKGMVYVDRSRIKRLPGI